MAEITSDTVEYATIERLGAMLRDPNEPFKVTESYALFTAILCWVLQRIRTPEHHGENNDITARQVRRALEQQVIEDVPWQINTVRDADAIEGGQPVSFPSFARMNAFEFLKALRDAVAHGDARSISPVNENSYLIGHKFHCEAQRGHVIGAIILRRDDMRRLGTSLADLYCQTMRHALPDTDIAEDATHLQEKAA